MNTDALTSFSVETSDSQKAFDAEGASYRKIPQNEKVQTNFLEHLEKQSLEGRIKHQLAPLDDDLIESVTIANDVDVPLNNLMYLFREIIRQTDYLMENGGQEGCGLSL